MVIPTWHRCIRHDAVYRALQQLRRLLLRLLLPLIFGLCCMSMPASAEWLRADGVRLQALDKITARIFTLEIWRDDPVLFGTLQVTLKTCDYQSPDKAPEDAALLVIHQVSHDGIKDETPLFSGWMFASSPAVHALEHPVYDLTVLSCLPKSP